MNILPHTFEHRVPGGKVELLGACDSVTGAMTRVDLQNKPILVDCGEPQGSEADGWEFPEAAYDVQAVVLTHGHLKVANFLCFGVSGGWRTRLVRNQAGCGRACALHAA